MDKNDYRLNAYRQSSAKSSSSGEEKNKNEKKSDSHVYTPVFRKIKSSSFSDSSSSSSNSFSNEKKSASSKEKDKSSSSSQIKADNSASAARTGTWFQKMKSVSHEDVVEASKQLLNGGLIKVGERKKEADGRENIYRRVAKFLILIGVDEAAKILPHLTQEQTEKIIPEIASISHIDSEDAEAILNEFNFLMVKAREEGGLETARNILTKAYGKEKAEEIIEKSAGKPSLKPFEYLEDADGERIAVLLEGESPAVKALVLSQLEAKKAASIINSLNGQEKALVISRLAKMEKVSPQILETLDKSLHEKLMTQNTSNSKNLDGRGVLAQILRRMDPIAESKIISSISEDDQNLAADLKERLFTKEDIINADDRYLQNKLFHMDEKEIAVLICGKDDDFRKKILSNVSKTKASTILEEESFIRPVKKSDSEEITSKFFAELRRAWEDGELFVKGRDDGEVYV